MGRHPGARGVLADDGRRAGRLRGASILRERGPAVVCGVGYRRGRGARALARRARSGHRDRPGRATASVLPPEATEQLASRRGEVREAVAAAGREAALDAYLDGRLPALGPGAGRIPLRARRRGARGATSTLFAELPAVPAWERSDAELAAATIPSLIVDRRRFARRSSANRPESSSREFSAARSSARPSEAYRTSTAPTRSRRSSSRSPTPSPEPEASPRADDHPAAAARQRRDSLERERDEQDERRCQAARDHVGRELRRGHASWPPAGAPRGPR